MCHYVHSYWSLIRHKLLRFSSIMFFLFTLFCCCFYCLFLYFPKSSHFRLFYITVQSVVWLYYLYVLLPIPIWMAVTLRLVLSILLLFWILIKRMEWENGLLHIWISKPLTSLCILLCSFNGVVTEQTLITPPEVANICHRGNFS